MLIKIACLRIFHFRWFQTRSTHTIYERNSCYLILSIFRLSVSSEWMRDFRLVCNHFKCVSICSDFRPTSLEKGQEIFRLRIYKVYAWGVPLIITGTAATWDQLRKNAMTEVTFLQPRFCEQQFWFSGKLHSYVSSALWHSFSSMERTSSHPISTCSTSSWYLSMNEHFPTQWIQKFILRQIKQPTTACRLCSCSI